MKTEKKSTSLHRLTKSQLVKIAYAENVGEREFISECRGPFRKEVIIDATQQRRKQQGFAQ